MKKIILIIFFITSQALSSDQNDKIIIHTHNIEILKTLFNIAELISYEKQTPIQISITKKIRN